MSDSRSNHSNTLVITPYTSNNFDAPTSRRSFSHTGNVKRTGGSNSSQVLSAKCRLSRTKKTVPFLLSCVVFLIVLCACLVAALVVVGRHVMAAAMAGQNGGFLTKGGLILENIKKQEKTIPPIFRLPNDTRPTHYDITLMPDLQNASFKGKIKITVELTKEKDYILLHSYKLLIDKIFIQNLIANEQYSVVARTVPPLETSSNELNFTALSAFRMSENDSYEMTTNFPPENDEDSVVSNDRNVTVAGFELIEEAQMLRINLKNKIGKGSYDISIEFQGDMKNKLVGLHMVQYNARINGTRDTEKRAIATTKFEPTYARQAYPCFDEPNLKAKYKVHLLKPKGDGFIALSNMPEEGEPTPSDEGVMVHFQTSETMSTYLVCFIVSTMGKTETTFGPDKKQLRVFATPGQEKKTDYARETGKNIMDFYLDYFGIPYPLPKLDMVAIPDFVSGAMENWGLVTYRETALLYDVKTNSAANKARVAEVVAHELAHSWFGNLVTMNWWDDLWLNEGFASYIEYKGVEAAEKDWQMMDQFLIADLHDVLVLDATTASHPIVQKAETPDQITAMFDTISYKKGASILRMLEDSITPDKFKEGVKNYLEKYKWGNAVTEDFWTEMTGVAGGEDISAIMKTWTTQMGYPVVTVTKSGGKYTLKQARYLTNSASGDSEAEYKWTIPITYITNNQPKQRQLIWFRKEQPDLEIEIPNVDWVKFNFHQIGYYRTNYPAEDWKTFADLLVKDIKSFDVSDRANLLEESFRLAESGHISYTIPLDLSTYLSKEDDFICWSVADRVLTQLKKYMFNFDSNADYQKYISDLVSPITSQLKWDELPAEPDLRKRLRAVVLSLACSMGDDDCLKAAQTKFLLWLEGPEGSDLPQNLKGIIYNYGIRHASKMQWESVLEKYKNEADANEKSRLLEALSRVENVDLLQRLILFAQSRDNIRDQDYFSCMALISANPIGTPLVWTYVRSNWDAIVARFSLNERNLGRMIPQVTKSFSTEISLEEMETFFKNNPNAGAGASARLEAIETVKNNIKWVKNYGEVVSNWISKRPNF